MSFRFAGIRRKEIYSPNQTTNDELILNKTAKKLAEMGADFTIYEEKDIVNNKINEEVIFTMARGYDSLNILMKMEKEGKIIINSPRASFNCYRVNLVEKLKNAGIPFPNSKVVATDSGDNHKVSDVGVRKIWIKRGDVHAVHREDVSLVYGDEELNFLLKEFRYRGIKEVILQEHIYGDVIKFYSVRDSDFFRWYYLNGNNNYIFDINQLEDYAKKSAEILDLHVYGGDAIVSENGKITIIDFNDWPSFAPFRDEASNYIAKAIYSYALKFSE